MSTRLMSIQVFCCGVIYFLCQVTLSDCEVTWVTRNVTDSFRIDQDGCLKDENVCTTTASCQNDGSCLCNKDKPHFRNPTIILSGGSLSFGNSYGCITSEYVVLSNSLFSEDGCKFEPVQVIPNDPKQPATTEFNYNGNRPQFTSCKFEKLEAKYPNNNTRIQIPWLNETYIQLTTSGKTLSFQWTKSVTKLQGLIIMMKLDCKSTMGQATECLQAKVLGTWRSSGSPSTTERLQSTVVHSSSTTMVASHSISVSPNNGSFLSPTSSYHTTTTYSSTSPSNAQKSSSDEGGADVVTIAVAVVVPLFLIAVILLVIYLVKRRKGNRNNEKSKRSTTQENNGKDRVNIAMGRSHENKNTQSTPSGSEYATPSKPGIQRIVVNGDTYAVSSKEKKEPNQKDTAAAPNVSSDSEDPKPDIERVVVNGDTYAVVNQNKTTKEPKQELNYMDPENLRLDNANPDFGQSSQPTEYAPIVGVMQTMG